MLEEKIYRGGTFDVLISTEQQSDNKRLGLHTSVSSSRAAVAKNNIPMISGTKYRILIYDAANNTLVSNVDATAGNNPVLLTVYGGFQIRIKPGDRRIYAESLMLEVYWLNLELGKGMSM
ncbi:hypothetical protein CMT84_05655 [Elizabethkingia anophelis]|nr:hypothetical protein [Elizabethkingia anophelis]